MGWSSGLLLDTTGACALVGRLRAVWAILACVSWSARSMSRDRSNVAVMRAVPTLADDVIVMTPVTCDMASSMGLMIPVSTSSGEPPGQAMLTVIAGLSTSGNWLMPMRVMAMIPKRIVPNIIIQARTGL